MITLWKSLSLLNFFQLYTLIFFLKNGTLSYKKGRENIYPKSLYFYEDLMSGVLMSKKCLNFYAFFGWEKKVEAKIVEEKIDVGMKEDRQCVENKMVFELFGICFLISKWLFGTGEIE